MAKRNTPLFLERKGYRARRVMDAVRLLPVFGVALWMIPLLWSEPGPDTQGTTLSQALRYMFGVWAVLIGLTLWLWALARRDGDNARSGTPK